MKSAMATLSMLLPLLAFGGERGEEIWTVSRSVDDFDGVSRVTAMSPLSYGDPYGWSRVSARCTDGWQHELYFSFDYLNRREDSAPIQVKLGDRKPEQCGVSESTSDKALFLIRDTEQYGACGEMVREKTCIATRAYATVGQPLFTQQVKHQQKSRSSECLSGNEKSLEKRL